MAERVNIDDTDIDDSLAYLVDGKYFTGEIVETNSTGRIIELMTVVNGEADGPDRAWYSDGILKSEQHLVRGRVVGTARRWHPNGVLALQREFDEQGKLVKERLWTEEGEEVVD